MTPRLPQEKILQGRIPRLLDEIRKAVLEAEDEPVHGRHETGCGNWNDELLAIAGVPEKLRLQMPVDTPAAIEGDEESQPSRLSFDQGKHGNALTTADIAPFVGVGEGFALIEKRAGIGISRTRYLGEDIDAAIELLADRQGRPFARDRGSQA